MTKRIFTKTVLTALFLIISLFFVCSCDSDTVIPESPKEIFTMGFSLVRENSKLLAVDTGFVSGEEYLYKAVPLFSYKKSNPPWGIKTEWTPLCLVESKGTVLEFQKGRWSIEIGLPDENGNIVYQGSKTFTADSSSINETVYLYPVRTGSGSMQFSVSVTSLSLGTSVKAYYGALGEEETSITLSAVETFGTGDNAVFTGEVKDLEPGYYVVRFILVDEVNNIEYRSGEMVVVLVGYNQCASVTGTLLTPGQTCTVTISYYDSENVEKTVEITSVVGQVLENLYTNSVLSMLDGIGYETSLYDEAEGSGSALPDSTVIGGNITCYAHRVKYDLSWDFAGGSPSDQNYTQAGAVYAQSQILAPNLTKTGYNVPEVAWSPEFSGFMPKAATIYTAQWSPISYTVKFNANKPTSASSAVSGTMSDQSFTYDVSQNLRNNGFSLTGWTFGGWNTNSNGSGSSYNNSASVSNLSSTDKATVNLYAKWSANKYNATFKPNGGSLDSSTSDVVKEQTYDSNWVTPSNKSKTGYTFQGWSETSNGSTINYTTWKYTAAKTFYAIWTANTYTVTLNKGNVSGASIGGTATSFTVTYDGKYSNLANYNPTATGCVFVGWSD